MNIREVTALVLLYDACRDADLRARVARLVPDITDVADALAPHRDEPCRWIVEVLDEREEIVYSADHVGLASEMKLINEATGDAYHEHLKATAPWMTGRNITVRSRRA